MAVADTLAGGTPTRNTGVTPTKAALISITPAHQPTVVATDGLAPAANDEGLARRTWTAGQTITFVCFASFALWAAIGYGIVRLLAR